MKEKLIYISIATELSIGTWLTVTTVVLFTKEWRIPFALITPMIFHTNFCSTI